MESPAIRLHEPPHVPWWLHAAVSGVSVLVILGLSLLLWLATSQLREARHAAVEVEFVKKHVVELEAEVRRLNRVAEVNSEALDTAAEIGIIPPRNGGAEP